MTPSWQIIQGNALDLLADLPPADCIITDPPYGDTSLSWDKEVAWLDLVNLKPGGSVWFFTSLRHLLNVDLSGWKLAQEIVWEKHNGSSLANDRFRRVHELAVHLYKGKWGSVYKEPVFTMDATARVVRKKTKPTHIHGETGSTTYISHDGGPRLMRSVIKARSSHGHAIHPTQKPISVVRSLIEYSCPPGGLVVDPFCGSGTTLLAAKALDRRSIGIEIQKEYVDRARLRLENDAPLFKHAGAG